MGLHRPPPKNDDWDGRDFVGQFRWMQRRIKKLDEKIATQNAEIERLETVSRNLRSWVHAYEVSDGFVNWQRKRGAG